MRNKNQHENAGFFLHIFIAELFGMVFEFLSSISKAQKSLQQQAYTIRAKEMLA